MAKTRKPATPADLPEGQLIREPSKRPVGRPKRTAPVITPAKLEMIGIMFLQAVPVSVIAERLSVATNAIHHHLDTTLRPRWRARATERFDEELAKVEYLEQVAWERFHESQKPESHEQLRHALSEPDADGKTADPKLVERVVKTITRTGESCWLDIVRWCRDYFAKVHGFYKSDPLTDTKTADRPVIVNVLVGSRQEANAAIQFEEFTRLAKEQNVPGAEILDVKAEPANASRSRAD